MTTKYETGAVLTGKVTGIQPYGAFIALDDQTQGLVHISEIKHGFVKDINEVLSIGEEVKVKVLNVDEEKGKISLSIRATEEAPKQQAPRTPRRQGTIKTEPAETSNEGFNTLKDKLQEWIEQSRDELIKK
ncbi:S1 domain-containing post-transcriptional regulator GSP13 [Lederbergia citri]|uniref:General stress protein 13 n=1 Tax=Lederbergia citri TaxID=2833580 RepID=A0A942TFG1_9BACI|nr:S1 domain-containing post-transcriptional regulator GSP13 [Lederbergia citri]MBS4195194.1 general stress protein 13 [Lederbergia citri]